MVYAAQVAVIVRKLGVEPLLCRRQLCRRVWTRKLWQLESESWEDAGALERILKRADQLLKVPIHPVGAVASRQGRHGFNAHALVERELELECLLESVRVKQRNALAQVVRREARVDEVDVLEGELFSVLLLGVRQELLEALERLLGQRVARQQAHYGVAHLVLVQLLRFDQQRPMSKLRLLLAINQSQLVDVVPTLVFDSFLKVESLYRPEDGEHLLLPVKSGLIVPEVREELPKDIHGCLEFVVEVIQ